MRKVITFILIVTCFVSLLLSGCIVEEAKSLAPPSLPPGFENSKAPNVALDGYLYLSQGCPILITAEFGLPFQAKVNRALGCLSPSDPSEASWARIAFSFSDDAQAAYQAIPESEDSWKLRQNNDLFLVYGQGSGAESLVMATNEDDFVLFRDAYPDTYRMMNRLPTNPPGNPVGAGFLRPGDKFENWLRGDYGEATDLEFALLDLTDTLEKAKIGEIVIGLYSKKDLNLIRWEELEQSGLSALLVGKSSYPGLVISQVLPRIGLTEDFIDDEKIYVATFDDTQAAIKSVGGYIYISLAPKPEEAKCLLRTALAKLDLVSLPIQPPAKIWVVVDSHNGANIFMKPKVNYEDIPATFAFDKDLKYGAKSEDVKYLQAVLKKEIGPPIYPKDVGATGYFGDVTKAAVTAFQEKYASEILAPLGLTKGTGYVRGSTRAKLNALLGIRKQIPNGWVLCVTNTHQDKEIYDGHIWWEVKEGNYEPYPAKGWVTKECLEEVSPKILVPSTPASYFVDVQDKVKQAINWAENNKGSWEWENYCLRFAEEAFEVKKDIGWGCPQEGIRNCPMGGVAKLKNEDKFYSSGACYNPPRGALLFFSGQGSEDEINYTKCGHIGIYLGDGKVVHAYGEVKIQSLTGIEKEKYIDCYIGWAYPPDEWFEEH